MSEEEQDTSTARFFKVFFSPAFQFAVLPSFPPSATCKDMFLTGPIISPNKYLQAIHTLLELTHVQQTSTGTSMVLSEIWTLAFGAQSSLPDQEDPDLTAHRLRLHPNNPNYDSEDDDSDSHEERQEAAIAKILARQRVLVDAERDILGTTVYLPVPNVRDEAAENKSGFILVVTSLTLNNIGCYPFFGIRDRHQVSNTERCSSQATCYSTAYVVFYLHCVLTLPPTLWLNRCSQNCFRRHRHGLHSNTSSRSIGHKEYSGYGTACHAA
jgi:hypothetical protein